MWSRVNSREIPRILGVYRVFTRGFKSPILRQKYP
jgi:hypothetical protein